MFEKLTKRFIPNTKESARIYRIRIGVFQGWISVLVNMVLFISKMAIGLMAGSVSVIADAFHTLSDVFSSGVVIWGFRASEKPADKEHPYGHGRVEYIATLIIAILLGVASVEFFEVSVRRIISPSPVNAEWWMVGVIAFTIVIKETTARYAEFLSTKIASGTLHADAWHHRIDALSSLLVIGAMVAGKFGYYQLDGWAGIGIALFIIWTAFHIARDAVDDLIGKPPTSDEINEIRRIVRQVNGVLGVHDITIHSYGNDKYVSCHVEINADETTASAHDLSEDVENQLTEILGVSPTIHIDPVQPGNPLAEKVRSFLDKHWSNDPRVTSYHDIRIVDTENHHVILFGINVNPGMSQGQIIECCNEMEESLTVFSRYEVSIKVSHPFQY